MAVKFADAYVEVHADTSKIGGQVTSATGSIKPASVKIDGDTKGLVQSGKEAGKNFAGNFVGALGLAGIGLSIGASLTEGIQQSAQNSKLAASLGVSGDQAKQLGKVAGDVYAGAWGESMEEVNAATKSAFQQIPGFANMSKSAMEGVTSGAFDISSAFDVDVSDAIKGAGQLMNTGLAKNSQDAFDIITKGFQAGDDKAGDFLDTLNEYGAQFQKLGIDGATATGLISQGLKAGARDGDLVADSLKEFSIRAIDGSETTKQGFQQLGLNATDMATKISKGGTDASSGLQTVLDHLRNIKDPILQAQAATNLFGTQSEDLGKALFALDPSKAVSSIGAVGGAAAKMGKELNDNAATNIESFKRQLTQTFTTVVGEKVIPAIASVSSSLSTNLGPAFSVVAGIVRDGIGFYQEHSTLLNTLAIITGTLALGMGALAISTMLATGAMTAFFTESVLVTGLKNAWAALNLVMETNPILIVVTALAALALGLVYAYQHSETFRDVVNGVWSAIQTGVGAVVGWFQTTVLPVLQSVWDGISGAVTGLWNNVLSPVFGWIGSTFSAVIGGIQTAWNDVGSPVFQLIGAIVAWLWDSIFGVYLALIKAEWNAMMTAMQWAWDNILSPVFGAIGSAANTLWNVALSPIFTAIGEGWNAMGTGLKWVWDTIISPAFEALKSGVGLISGAFEGAVKAIGAAWNGLEEVAKAPIRFIVNTVINDGLIAGFNKLADFFKTDEIKKVELPKGFATGGIYPGYTPGRDVGYIGVSGGEAIMRPEWTRAVGSGYVHQMNAIARTRGVSGVQDFLGGFDGGGIPGLAKTVASKVGGAAKKVGGKVAGAAKHAASAVGSAAKSTVEKAAGVGADIIGFLSDPKKGFTDLIDNALKGGNGSGWAALAANAPRHLIQGAVDKVKGFMSGGGGGDATPFTGMAAGGVQRWLPTVLQALGMTGQPASLAQTLLRRMNQESGGNPTAINNWDINAKRGTPSKGLMQVIDPTFKAHAMPGYSSNIYDPLSNILSSIRYAVTRYGSLANAYNRPGGYANGGIVPQLFDSGGYLAPGMNLVSNQTRRPEMVLDAETTAGLKAMVAGGRHAPVVETINITSGGNVREDIQEVTAQLRRYNRGSGGANARR